MAERVDNVQHVHVPRCSQNAALSYALAARVRRPRFVGINVRGPDGYALLGAVEELDSALQVNVTFGGGRASTGTQALLSMSKTTVDDNLTVISRGIFAPQAWYPVPRAGDTSGSGAENGSGDGRFTEVHVHICRRVPLGYGHNATSLRNAGGVTYRTTHENVAVVGGLVVLV